MKRLVFICSGNTCRSPMAKGLFVKHLEDRKPELIGEIEVMTAGTSPNSGEGASRGAMKAMEEVGVDLSDHKAQPVSEAVLAQADWILTMTRSHRDYLTRIYGKNDKLFTLYEFLGQDKDVLDPFGGDVAVYRACRNELQQLIEMLIEKLAGEIKQPEDEVDKSGAQW
ncbi:MAG: low molecular weight protein arginine phosphatase [Syntrophomonadales bacterium]|jgi:protein-tyrosine-phosphatase